MAGPSPCPPPQFFYAGGGHKHSGVSGYHYHAQLVAAKSPTGQAYTAYIAGPYKCWKGDLSKIKNFWDLTGTPTKTASYGAGPNPSSRTDYAELRPCCGSTDYYVAKGYTINGAGAVTKTI